MQIIIITLSREREESTIFLFFLSVFLSFFLYYAILREFWEILSIMYKNIVFPITSREIKLASMTLSRTRGKSNVHVRRLLVFPHNLNNLFLRFLKGGGGSVPIARYTFSWRYFSNVR